MCDDVIKMQFRSSLISCIVFKVRHIDVIAKSRINIFVLNRNGRKHRFCSPVSRPEVQLKLLAPLIVQIKLPQSSK